MRPMTTVLSFPTATTGLWLDVSRVMAIFKLTICLLGQKDVGVKETVINIKPEVLWLVSRNEGLVRHVSTRYTSTTSYLSA